MFRLTESGVTKASKRFEESIMDDKNLKEMLIKIREDAGFSIVKRGCFDGQAVVVSVSG